MLYTRVTIFLMGVSFPGFTLHYYGRSGKVGDDGSLWAALGAAWVGMGGRRIEHSVQCGLCPHSRPKPHLGIDNADGSGKNV